jgi:hypothetical protein
MRKIRGEGLVIDFLDGHLRVKRRKWVEHMFLAISQTNVLMGSKD